MTTLDRLKRALRLAETSPQSPELLTLLVEAIACEERCAAFWLRDTPSSVAAAVAEWERERMDECYPTKDAARLARLEFISTVREEAAA